VEAMSFDDVLMTLADDVAMMATMTITTTVLVTNILDSNNFKSLL
jgi:hypothetical protein